jgi:flavodoxin
MKRISLLRFLALVFPFSLAVSAETGGQKVLIIYFSLTGNTKAIVETLRQKTGGDIFRVETVRTYPLDPPELYDDPKRELEAGVWPELKSEPPVMNDYDLILVGGPVWWYTVSTPLRSFLDKADFAGKKVAAFVTHGGSVGDYYQFFRDNAKNAIVLDGIDFHSRTESDEIGRRLDAWLVGLR